MKISLLFILMVCFFSAFAQNNEKNNASLVSGNAISLQNYPNPFNSTTVISYNLPQDIHVSLKIYNIIGVELTTLKDRYEEKGNHSITYNAASLPSGVYIYVLKAGEFTQKKKLILIK